MHADQSSTSNTAPAIATSMPAQRSAPSMWDDSRDATFFRLTATLFTAEFAFGAGVLLAGYDEA